MDDPDVSGPTGGERGDASAHDLVAPLRAGHDLAHTPPLRDLGILRDHYLRHDGGVLTVRQGEASDELFEARLAVLESWLGDEGVQMASVTIEHDLYTGDGKRSTRAAGDYVRPSADNPYDFHQSGDQ